MASIKLEEIKFDPNNDLYGIYKSGKWKSFVDIHDEYWGYFMVIRHDDTRLDCFNFAQKILLRLNISTKRYNVFRIKDITIDIRKIYIDYGNNEEVEGLEHNTFVLKRERNQFIINYKNINYNLTKQGKNEKTIKELILRNPKFTVTRGGTRKVYLLDNIVIKEVDKSCNPVCEQLTNYFAVRNKVNICEFLGFVWYNEILMICERKYKPIDWKQIFNDNELFYSYKEKWSKFIVPFKNNEYSISGDYNLGNILEDEKGDLIVTDLNATYLKFIVGILITSNYTANDYDTRIIDYVTDNRIVESFKSTLKIPILKDFLKLYLKQRKKI